jgi:hypothetical protein
MRWTIARNFRGKSERPILDDMVFERFEVGHHFAGEWLRTPPVCPIASDAGSVAAKKLIM